jgi:hypothetical protein
MIGLSDSFKTAFLISITLFTGYFIEIGFLVV